MLHKILRDQKLALVMMSLPFFIYYLVIDYFALNIPFYDDFSVLLEPVNAILASSSDLDSQIALLFKPNASHVPAITRSLVLIQAMYMGGINFKYTIIAGNVGLMLTALTLIIYFQKKYLLPWYSLLPVPFFLLAITHWEAMDFVTPAWQMYWGACLFPILCFIAITESYFVLASLAFGAALFLSSGGLCLYPLILGYYAIKKRWRDGLVFGALAGCWILLFFHFLPASQGVSGLPDLLQTIRFIPAFMGNIVSNGSWDLQSYKWIHISIGVFVLITGGYAFWKFENADVAKLTFVYVVVLAAMAIYARGVIYQYVPPRYSMFPALAIVCLSCIYTANWLKSSSPHAGYKILTLAIFSILVWAHSLYKCVAPLESNRHTRAEAAQKYLAGDHNALIYLLWSADYGQAQLIQAKELGVYDIGVLKLASPQ